MYDPVKQPLHYEGDGKISCMDALKSMMSFARITSIQAYWWGCAFKYLWRWPFKNGRQDVEKCMQCLEYLHEELSDFDQVKAQVRHIWEKEIEDGQLPEDQS